MKTFVSKTNRLKNILNIENVTLIFIFFVTNRNISPGRRIAKRVMSSMPMNYFMLFLVVCYVILIFIDVAMEDLLTTQ
jgi:hypothetical protein